ncbi:MAG: hypothetical protein GY797_10450 [Deltaproteobacteria bacterium]|nr:hypothetical protein [Deltaproteobacteria bacterium]
MEQLKEKNTKELFLGVPKIDFLLSIIIPFFCSFGYYFHSQNIGELCFIFIIVFIVLYGGSLSFGGTESLIYKFTGEKIEGYNDICNTCHSVVSRSKEKMCECGGQYEPLENWKWEEDEIMETEETN